MAEKMCNLVKNSGGVQYSTSEQIIGKWADGKTLYQKSYYGTGNYTSDLTLDTSVTSATHSIKSIKETYKGSSDFVNGRTDAYNNGTRVYMMTSIGPDYVFIQIGNAGVTEYNVTIEYTK